MGRLLSTHSRHVVTRKLLENMRLVFSLLLDGCLMNVVTGSQKKGVLIED